MFDLADVKYVRRITVGSSDPEKRMTEEEAAQAMAFLNRCLSEGQLIGLEKSFSVFNIDEEQVVVQAVIYHVGFTRRPQWMPEES
ncbi:hypothetical protein FHS83_002883 [Rhizomicrobium palustre]|uniref:Uncharacterized protein n=1 Tax=Rhizomicrobium palustre TaxID=189966 RepID=A0A846N255_9PROT|nr:hypothetical protein [Rhizomicrobium palustre]NIK89565.1 hypothetical protein [Rhizomicrobium palustre]